MSKIRVLIIEDQVLTRVGIKTVLNETVDIAVVGEAATTSEGLNALKQIRPDVTLLSLWLPDSCAVETIADYLKIEPKAKILIVAAHAGDVEINRTLERGAFGYILKDVSAEDLIKAIKKVYAGKKFVATNVAEILAEHSGHENLTTSEQKVLRLIVAGNSNKEIAKHLAVTENTVKTHVKSILAKLAVADRTAAATAAIKRGLVRVK